MKILYHCPVPLESTKGNAVCAKRTLRLLSELSHEMDFSEDVGISAEYKTLIVQHAVRSQDVIGKHHASIPIILVITGTELLVDHQQIQDSLNLSWRIVVTSDEIRCQLPEYCRDKVRVIPRSVDWPEGMESSDCQPTGWSNIVTIIGHLREVKRPFLTAEAAERLPVESLLQIHHYGLALEPEMETQAKDWMERVPRYKWRGGVSRDKVFQLLQASLVSTNTSIVEGGANVLAESAVCGTPVLATRIPGSIGLLGDDYVGLFDVDDAGQLAEMLRQVELRGSFYQQLLQQTLQRAPTFHLDHERAAWRRLLQELPTGE